MNSSKLLLLVCSLICSFVSGNAYACSATERSNALLYASYDRGALSDVGSSNTFKVQGCGHSILGKYFLATIGADIIGLDYSRSTSYNGYFGDDACKIVNSPFGENPTYKKRLSYYQEQVKLVQKCVVAEVQDLSERPIIFPASQKGCKITRINDKTALAEGGYCYFRFNPGGGFKVTYRIKDECADSDYLKKHKLTPRDIMAYAGFFISGSASGDSLDLDQIGSKDIRLSLEPSSKIMPLSVDMGVNEPRWPTIAALDLHLGDVKITQNSTSTMFRTSLLINNQCKAKCSDDICASACDRLVPVGAEMNLYKVTSSGNMLVDVLHRE